MNPPSPISVSLVRYVSASLHHPFSSLFVSPWISFTPFPSFLFSSVTLSLSLSLAIFQKSSPRISASPRVPRYREISVLSFSLFFSRFRAAYYALNMQLPFVSLWCFYFAFCVVILNLRKSPRGGATPWRRDRKSETLNKISFKLHFTFLPSYRVFLDFSPFLLSTGVSAIIRVAMYCLVS